MTAKIRDLARQLNLSITTISRALDGYPDVSTETRQRVIQAAREMGYEPSYAARHLRRQRADAIGYVLPSEAPQFSDPFSASFLTGLCDEAASNQIDIMISSAPPQSDQEMQQYQRWVQSKRVDGVILNRIRKQDWRIQYLAANHIPFVVLGKENAASEYPCVYADDRAGFKELIAHLAQQGRRRIAFIGADPDLIVHAERFASFQQALNTSGLSFIPELVRQSDLSETGGYHTTLQLLALPQPPTAILCANDLTAIGALHAVQEAGLTAGKDVAVAGYDGIQESEYTTPPLTTLAQPTYDMARQTVLMLTSLIQGVSLPQKQVVFQPHLILRASTQGQAGVTRR